MTTARSDALILEAIDGPTFQTRFRNRSPMLVRSYLRGSALLRRWTVKHLEDVAGHAQVDVLHFQEGSGDFGQAAVQPMALGEFIKLNESCLDRADHYYLFNEQTNIFTTSATGRGGWGAPTSENPGFSRLKAEFQLPAFLNEQDFTWASIILGNSASRTRLHFDVGGEGKVMLQLMGRKVVRLWPPRDAAMLGFGNSGDRTSLVPKPMEAFPEGVLPESDQSLIFELQPGDLLYWPAHWLHQVENLDNPTLAVIIGLDEIPFNPSVFAQIASYAPWSVRRFLCANAEAIQSAEDPAEEIHQLFVEYQALLFDDRLRDHDSLVEWYAAQADQSPPEGFA
ncbi:MAG: cupin-like domain-containing protein [Pseudomonadota bacterium]